MELHNDNKENREWYAAVLYKDKKTECVKVKYVKDFQPETLHDLDPTLTFKVKTNKWSLNKKAEYWRGVVEGLGVTKIDAENSRKASRRNYTPELKEKIAKTLREIPSEPSDLSSSDAGAFTDTENQVLEKRRAALVQANIHAGNQIQSNITSKTKHVKQNARKHKLTKEKTDLEKTQDRAKRARTAEQVKGQNEWSNMLDLMRSNTHGQTAFEVSASSQPLSTVSNLVSPSTTPRFSSVVTNSTRAASVSIPPSTCVSTSSEGQSSSSVSDVDGPSTSSNVSSQRSLPVGIFTNQSASLEVPSASSMRPSLSSLSNVGSLTPLLPVTPERRFVVPHITSVAVDNSEKDGSAAPNPCGRCLQDLRTEVSEMKQSLALILAQTSAIIEGTLTKQTSAASASEGGVKIVYGKVVIQGKVDLGNNFKCSEQSWKHMNECLEITDWCLAILRGTFGTEKAMLMRLIPRYADLLYFPQDFVLTAHPYYENFIDRRIRELLETLQFNSDSLAETQLAFFTDNKSTILSQLGASLADRAEGMHRQWLKKLERNGETLPVRTKRPKLTKSTPSPAGNKSKSKQKNILTLPKSLKRRTKNSKAPKDNTSPSTSNASTPNTPQNLQNGSKSENDHSKYPNEPVLSTITETNDAQLPTHNLQQELMKLPCRSLNDDFIATSSDLKSINGLDMMLDNDSNDSDIRPISSLSCKSSISLMSSASSESEECAQAESNDSCSFNIGTVLCDVNALLPHAS